MIFNVSGDTFNPYVDFHTLLDRRTITQQPISSYDVCKIGREKSADSVTFNEVQKCF